MKDQKKIKKFPETQKIREIIARQSFCRFFKKYEKIVHYHYMTGQVWYGEFKDEKNNVPTGDYSATG